MCSGNNVPDPSDTDDEMEASGTSEVPSQGGNLHVLNFYCEYCVSTFSNGTLTIFINLPEKSAFFRYFFHTFYLITCKSVVYFHNIIIDPIIYLIDTASIVYAPPSASSSGSAPSTGSKPQLTFPCLNLSKMTKEQKLHLHQRLYAESMDMIQKFQDLFSATTESLKRRKIAVREIVCHLVGLGPSPPAYKDLNLPTFRRKLPELTNAKTVDAAMLVIRNYCSFFNYYMIEHLIKRLGTRQDKKNLEKYKKEFSEYAEHHVFECPSEVGTVSEGLAEMVVTHWMKRIKAIL